MMAALLVGLLAGLAARAQDLVPLGPGEPAGSRSTVLPPPSGSQNPVLPPPSGFRYAPGTQGQWGDAPANPPRAARQPPSATRDLSARVTPTRAAARTDASAAQINTISGIGPAVARCWQPPATLLEQSDSGFTLRFSLRRNGTVIAAPRVTWRSGKPDAVSEQQLVETGLAALRQCAPLPLSPGLGAAIAGRPISLRFDTRG
ncbi:MAG: hypothetical protein ACRCWO_13095 [Bosea sp. (in: a-proteobacteria)]